MYSDLIQKEGIDSQFLMVLNPKRRAQGFTLFSGSVYELSFDFGEVSRVQVDGEELVKGTSTTLNAGEFYYDVEDEVLYVRTTSGVDPDTFNTVAFYELYVATKDEHWNRDPLDDSTRVVYFDAVVSESVTIKNNISDNLFGFYPVDTSTVRLINAEHIFEKHLYDSSFNKGSIKIYHALRNTYTDELDIDNIKQVYNGTMGTVDYRGGLINIQCYNTIDELAREYRNSDSSFYNTTDFPDLDPNSLNNPIRYVYGVVDSFIPVNVDYDEENPSATDNRNWAVIGEQNNLANIDALVAATPASTTTRTYLTSAQGLRVGDHVFMDHASLTDEYAEITNVDYISNFIEHAALSNAMDPGDFVRRGFVGAVYIIQDNVLYKAMYNRDYTIDGAMAGGCSGFIFEDNFESNLSMANLTPNDKVFCRVYGRTNDLTLNALPFGTDDAESGNLANPVAVILDLIKRFGIPESRINISSFTTALAQRDDAVGFAIPATDSDGFKGVKNVILDVLTTSLLKFYIDDDLKFKISAYGPVGAINKTIEDDEILKGSFEYRFSCSDVISKAIVQYGFKEVSLINLSNSEVSSVAEESDTAKYVHEIERQKTFQSLHFKEADATTLAQRLITIFGDRTGTVSFSTKNRFFDSDIDDNIEVTRTKLPGFSFDLDTDRSRELSVVAVNKSLRNVTLQLDDQKGIEDNLGPWS